MTWRRVLGIAFALLGVLVISALLYLAFADLGRHKQRIEAFVTQHTGREFVIEGPFTLKILPVITVLAERVRFANAEWGSKPQMVEVGHLSAEVGFWSLISGPVDIRSFELSDVTVLLEKQRKGKANWIFHEPVAVEDVESEPKTRTQFPVVIHKAVLKNVRLTWRSKGKPDVRARLDTLTITPGKAGLLGLDGSGKLDQYPIVLKGEAGPIDALLAGRNILMDVKGRFGRLGLDVDGSIGDLDPLDGANLRIKGRGEDFDNLLARLNLPVIATGALDIDAKFDDAGKRTNLVLAASVGDLKANARGSLAGLYLRDSDLTFEASAADAARLANVFDVHGLPAAPLSVSGRIRPTRREIRLDGLTAQLADLTSKFDVVIKRGRQRELATDFDVAVQSAATWHARLPPLPFAAKGKFLLDDEKLEISELAALFGENSLQGSLSVTRSKPRHLEANLVSPHLDLTPYLAQRQDAAKPTPAPAAAKPKAKPEFLFRDAPLPIRQLTGTEANLQLSILDLTLANKTFKDVSGTVIVDASHVELLAKARGSLDGAVNARLSLEPTGAEGANINFNFGLENVRAGLDMKEMQPEEVPPLSVTVDLTTHGASARQMAANSNGYVLLTQGAGKTKATFLNAFGGDMISQLRTRLNPFRAQDPFTQLDCTVMRADISNGAVTVLPVLVQTKKVTVAAKGKLDLHTEQLTFDFDTRPRKGIGVSPGMFTNPFIKLEGTLMNPRIAMGAKGVGSGAVAAATGGLSVIAGGFIDRLKGEANMCRRTLEKAMAPAQKG